MMTEKQWPKNQTHFQMIEHMDEILQNQDKWIYSNKLAEKIGENYEGISTSTARAYLSTYRDYLTSDEPFTADERPDGTSGHTTVYWKHEDNDVEGMVTPHEE